LGAGKSPPWPNDRAVTLQDEVTLIEPIFTLAGTPLCLVGHSYGAAVALIAALKNPGSLRAIAVYEPTLFALLEAESPGNEAVRGIRDAAADAAAAIDAQNHHAAAKRFIDYWMGAGTWSQMPKPRQSPVAASMTNIKAWARALFDDTTGLQVFGTLQTPILYMTGANSPPSSRGVARLLVETLPNVTHIDFDGLGHMGPITHSDQVNDAILRFLKRD
jgi:pimeloyl-ACP methyl ester carboxylesterase